MIVNKVIIVIICLEIKNFFKWGKQVEVEDHIFVEKLKTQLL